MINPDKVRFSSRHISVDEIDEDFVMPILDNPLTADIHQIAAFIHAIIRLLEMNEYDVRQYLTEHDFGNTEIVSLLISGYCEGSCTDPLWRCNAEGKLEPIW